MKNIIQAVKGTREFYPQEMAIRNWLYEKIRQVSRSYGYSEYDGPFLEPIALYAAKSGEELVKEQSFVFPDRGGNMIALRPELTPSLARMIAKKQHQLSYPLRWWSFGPFWRYEKPQKGRAREFFQWNIDLIGCESPESDAELVAICADFFREVGLAPDQVKVFVNNRRLMDKKLSELGIDTEIKKSTLNVIDRQDKMDADTWKAYALDSGLTEVQFNGLVQILDDEDLYKESEDLLRVFGVLENLKVSEYVQFDAKIVRGLDYYTGVVFEGRDVGKNSRAILGGGRYDNLVQDVGGDPLTGVGFAMGDVVIPIILSEYGVLPELSVNPVPIMVTVFDESMMAESLSVSAMLRKNGFLVQMYPEPAKMGKQFKYAGQSGARFAVVIGPDEKTQGIVQVKDLSTREQTGVPLEDLAEHFRALLAD